jgi:hypothetical protein
MRILPILFTLTAFAFGSDDASQREAPVVLTATSSRVIAQASLAASGMTQCDAKGNLFFYTGAFPQDSVIFELFADGSHEVFGLINEDAKNYYYSSFRVDSDGGVWLLAGNKGDKPVVFRLNEDPTTPERTELEVPAGMSALTVHNFIELQSGHFLLQGFFDKTAPKKSQGRSYFAEFDSSGKLVRKFVEKENSEVDLRGWVGGDTPAIEGEDGSIYILEPDKVLVLSQAARITRKIKLEPPEPDYRPYQMYLSKGRLEVSYSDARKSPRLEPLYVLLDVSTGRQLRVYKPASELGNHLLCFSDKGFTFYRTEHGQIKLVIARAE